MENRRGARAGGYRRLLSVSCARQASCTRASTTTRLRVEKQDGVRGRRQVHRRVERREIDGEEHPAEHEPPPIARLGRNPDRTQEPSRTTRLRRCRYVPAPAGGHASGAESAHEPPLRERGQRPGHAMERGCGLWHVAQPHEHRVGGGRDRPEHDPRHRKRRKSSRPRRGAARHWRRLSFSPPCASWCLTALPASEMLPDQRIVTRVVTARRVEPAPPPRCERERVFFRQGLLDARRKRNATGTSVPLGPREQPGVNRDGKFLHHRSS